MYVFNLSNCTIKTIKTWPTKIEIQCIYMKYDVTYILTHSRKNVRVRERDIDKGQELQKMKIKDTNMFNIALHTNWDCVSDKKKTKIKI